MSDNNLDKKKVKIAIVGCGFMGQVAHLHNYLYVKGCEVVALAESRDLQRELISKKHNISKTYRKHDEMLADDQEIDAVVIVTQRDMTGPIAYDCLNAGKHVITEKPMASTHEQAKKLVALANEKELIYMVGYMRRYDLGVEKGKELFDELCKKSELGKLTYIRIHCFDSNPYCNEDDYIQTNEEVPKDLSRWPSAPDWIPENLTSDYAFFLNVFCHSINFMRFITDGNPRKIGYTHLGNMHARIVSFEYDNFNVLLEAGRSLSRLRDEYCEIFFEKGVLKISFPPNLLRNQPARVTLHRFDEKHAITEYIPDWSWAFRRQAETFVRSIQNNGYENIASGTDSLEDMKTIEEIWRNELIRIDAEFN